MDNPGDLYPNTSGKYKPIAARVAAAASTSSSSSFGPAAPLLTASAPPFFSGPVAAAPLTSSTSGPKRPLKPGTAHQIIELGSGNKITTNNQNQLIIDGRTEDDSSPLDISPKGGYFLSIYDQSTQNNIFPTGNILLYKDGNTNSLSLDYKVNKSGTVIDYTSGFIDGMYIHATPESSSSPQRFPESRSSSSQPAAVAKEEHIIILDKNDKPIELNYSEVEKLLEQYKSVSYTPNQGAFLKINHYVNQFVVKKPDNFQNIEFIQFYTENGSMFIKIKINNEWSYNEKFGDDLIIQFAWNSNSSSSSSSSNRQTLTPSLQGKTIILKQNRNFGFNNYGFYIDDEQYDNKTPFTIKAENGYHLNKYISNKLQIIPTEMGLEIKIKHFDDSGVLQIERSTAEKLTLTEDEYITSELIPPPKAQIKIEGKGESLLMAGACGAAELSLKSINKFLVIVLIALLLIVIWMTIKPCIQNFVKGPKRNKSPNNSITNVSDSNELLKMINYGEPAATYNPRNDWFY